MASSPIPPTVRKQSRKQLEPRRVLRHANKTAALRYSINRLNGIDIVAFTTLVWFYSLRDIRSYAKKGVPGTEFAWIREQEWLSELWQKYYTAITDRPLALKYCAEVLTFQCKPHGDIFLLMQNLAALQQGKDLRDGNTTNLQDRTKLLARSAKLGQVLQSYLKVHPTRLATLAFVADADFESCLLAQWAEDLGGTAERKAALKKCVGQMSADRISPMLASDDEGGMKRELLVEWIAQKPGMSNRDHVTGLARRMASTSVSHLLRGIAVPRHEVARFCESLHKHLVETDTWAIEEALELQETVCLAVRVSPNSLADYDIIVKAGPDCTVQLIREYRVPFDWV